MAKLKPYTVVFYIDGDRAMETFVEKVTARNQAAAWNKAIKQARADGGTSSGYPIRSDEWESATEIVTFTGHPDVASD